MFDNQDPTQDTTDPYDPSLPPPNTPPATGADPLAGIPPALVQAFYGDGQISDRQAAANYLRPFVDAYTAKDWQRFFQQFTQDLRADPTILADAAGKLSGIGFSVLKNQAGQWNGKIKTPDGQIVDVIQNAGSGKPETMKWQWLTGGGPPDPNGGTGGVNPEYLAPWTQPFTGPEGVPDFESPTADSILNDPSYLWRRDQARGSLENSAAAKGVLNTGGTLYDILQVGDKMASQEYSNIWDRNFGLWNARWGHNQDAYNRAWQQYLTKRDTWYRNQNEPFDKLYKTASLGAQAAAG